MSRPEMKKCSKCKRELEITEFYKSQCKRCYEYQKQYKIDNAPAIREKQKVYSLKNCYCEICEYEVRLCKKKQHEQSDYHKDRQRRKEHPEEYENEEQPDWKRYIDGKEFFQCDKCKCSVMSSQWNAHCISPEHVEKKNKTKTFTNPNLLDTQYQLTECFLCCPE